jgi:hypothetical protein
MALRAGTFGGASRSLSGIEDYLPPEEERRILSQLASGTLSTVGYVGGSLDKLGRPVRQVLAELLNPKHKFEWSELLSWVPFSDTMGLTESRNQATGKDILDWDDPRSIWDDVAGFGVEVFTDPLNLVGLAGASVLSKGGKALGKMGMLDEALESAARVKGLRPKDVGGFRPRETRMTTTVGEALDYLKDNARLTARETGGKSGDSAARLIDKQFSDSLRSVGGDPATVMSEKIGGLFGLHHPLKPFGESIGLLGTGARSQKVAAAIDTAVDVLKHSPPITALRVRFSKKLGGAVTRLGQWAAGKGFASMRLATEEALTRVANAKRAMDASGIFDSVKMGNSKAIENHLMARQYLELSSRPARNAAGEAIQRLPKTESQLAKIKAMFDKVGLTTHLDDLSSGLQEVRRQADALGVIIPELADLEIGYWPRALFDLRGMDAAKEPMQLLKTSTESQIYRKEWLKNLPGGITGVMRLSSEPKFAIEIGGIAVPVSGLRDRMAQSGSKMTDLPYEQIRAMIKDRIAKGDLEDIVPTRSVQGKAMTEVEVNDQLDSIINFITGLDVRHADNGLPAFHLDVTEDFVRWMDSTHRAMGAADATHRMFAEAADLADNLIDVRDTKSVLEALTEVGLARARPGTEGLEYLESEMGGLRRFIAHFMSEQSGGAARTGMSLDPNMSTKDLIKALSKTPGGKELRIPKDYVDEAKRVLDAYISPNAETNVIVEALRLWQNAWRSGVTILFPGFHSRNFLGGQLNNFFMGAGDPRFGSFDPRRYLVPLQDTSNMLRGNEISGAADIFGGGMTDLEATNKLMELAWVHNVWNPHEGYKIFDPAAEEATRHLMTATAEPTSIAQAVKGYFLGGRGQDAALLRNTNLGTIAGTAADVLGAATPVGPFFGGLFGKGAFTLPGRGRRVLNESTQDVSKIYALGHKTASIVEAHNRLSPFIAFLRQGYSPAEAAKRVLRAQVDYRNLTAFERKYIRGPIPFYSFTKGMVPFFIEDILARPGGRQAHVVKGIARLQRDDPRSMYAPGWMRRGTALPVGGGDDWLSRFLGAHDPDAQRYIRSVGAPFEDVLSLVSTSDRPIQHTLTGLFSRTSPLIKWIPEVATGRSMFFDRDIRDLESRYFSDPLGGWQLGGRGGGAGWTDRFLDLLPGATRAAGLRKKFRDPGRYGSPQRVLLEELEPWNKFDVNLEEQKHRAIQQLLDPQLHGRHGIRQLPKMLYLPKERAEVLRQQDPDSYYRWLYYKQSTSRARAASRQRRIREDIIGGS